MYKCNHCNIEIPDNQAEGRVVKVGPKDNPKCYCMECGEPVVYIPDMPQATGGIHGAQATLISNSDNRITTNNYYGSGTPDEQIDTPYGPCRKSEAKFCKKCRQWVPIMYFNTERDLCDDCIAQEGVLAYEEAKTFFEIGLFGDALDSFLKYETVCNNSTELAKLHYYIGRCYFEQKQWKEAIRFFIKSCENNADSLFYMGLCFKNGYGVPKDEKKGIEYIQMAAQKRSQPAMDFITAEELKKREEDERIRIETEKENNRRKQQEIANKAYLEFKNKRFSESRQMWEKAINEGYQLSALENNCLGICYIHNYDYDKSYNCFSKAANMGIPDGAYNLGVLYERGIGIKSNPSEAAYWYEKSAEKGCIAASYKLSNMYENGNGVRHDHCKAVELLKKVAGSNDEVIEKELKYNFIKDDDSEMDLSPRGKIENIIASAAFELELMDF